VDLWEIWQNFVFYEFIENKMTEKKETTCTLQSRRDENREYRMERKEYNK
jgi:hypothetical protein